MSDRQQMRTLSRLQARTVLVVDDDAMLARILANVLQRRGLRVAVANSFAEAVAGTEVFKVGVFDIELGDGNGVDLAEQLIAQGRVTNCFFFTGGADPEIIARVQPLGELFSKSEGPTQLVAAVVALMSRATPVPAASR